MNDESEALCLAATWKIMERWSKITRLKPGQEPYHWRLIKAWEGYTATTTPRPGKGNAQHIFGSCIFSITGTSPISVTSWCLLGTHGPKGVSYSKASELLFKDHPTKQNCLKPWSVSPLSGGCPTCQRVETKWMISIRFISLSVMGAVVSHQWVIVHPTCTQRPKLWAFFLFAVMIAL